MWGSLLRTQWSSRASRAGGPPEAFESNVVHGTLRISPELRDLDLDGMPNGFESSYGLSANRADAGEDLDGTVCLEPG